MIRTVRQYLDSLDDGRVVACGDGCISKNYTCHQPPGCACNAY
jgi:hypothetical protein